MYKISQQRYQLSKFRDMELIKFLHRFVLSYEILKQLRYPLPDVNDHDALNQHCSNPPKSNETNLLENSNTNLYKFNSESSSDSSSEASDSESNFDETPFVKPTCVRCGVQFILNYITGKYIMNESCLHHWGKLRSGRYGNLWTCCNQGRESNGCTATDKHVWNGIVPGSITSYKNYVQTTINTNLLEDNDDKIYGLDCEMCFTTHGLELTKITVIDISGNVVYEKFVKPDHDIVDYNTRFSGITSKDLRNVKTKLHDVQCDLLSFISSNTILIGHGLENDLKALKIIHTKVIDSSLPLMDGFQRTPRHDHAKKRFSLKTCARNELKRDIQNGTHDSAEDARASVDIILQRLWSRMYSKKIKKDFRNVPKFS